MLVKKIARKFIYPVVTALGAEKLLRLGTNKNILILTYHGVTNDKYNKITERHLSSAQFEEHLSYFKKNFQVETVQSAIELFLSGKTSTKPVISITFDDGYYNNYSDAFPLLLKYNLPASMYITTKCLTDRGYIHWFDVFDMASKTTSLEEFKKSPALKSVQNGMKAISGWKELKRHIKTLDVPEKEIFMQELTGICNTKGLFKELPESYRRLVTAEEIKEMHKSGLIEFGSHSHTHHNLGSINTRALINELKKSKSLLESVLQKEITTIAYPDGSYNNEVVSQSLTCGYKNLLAVEYKNSDDSKIEHLYPRAGVSNTTTAEANFLHLNREFKNSGLK